MKASQYKEYKGLRKESLRDKEKSLGESVITKKNALNHKYIEDEKFIEDKKSKNKK